MVWACYKQVTKEPPSSTFYNVKTKGTMALERENSCASSNEGLATNYIPQDSGNAHNESHMVAWPDSCPKKQHTSLLDTWRRLIRRRCFAFPCLCLFAIVFWFCFCFWFWWLREMSR